MSTIKMLHQIGPARNLCCFPWFHAFLMGSAADPCCSVRAASSQQPLVLDVPEPDISTDWADVVASTQDKPY